EELRSKTCQIFRLGSQGRLEIAGQEPQVSLPSGIIGALGILYTQTRCGQIFDPATFFILYTFHRYRRPSRTFSMVSSPSFSPGHRTGEGLGATIVGTAGLTTAGTAGLTTAGTAGLTTAGLLDAGRLNVVAGGLNAVQQGAARFIPRPLGLKPGLANPLVGTTAPHATLLITGAVASSTPAKIKPNFLPQVTSLDDMIKHLIS